MCHIQTVNWCQMHPTSPTNLAIAYNNPWEFQCLSFSLSAFKWAYFSFFAKPTWWQNRSYLHTPTVFDASSLLRMLAHQTPWNKLVLRGQMVESFCPTVGHWNVVAPERAHVTHICWAPHKYLPYQPTRMCRACSVALRCYQSNSYCFQHLSFSHSFEYQNRCRCTYAEGPATLIPQERAVCWQAVSWGSKTIDDIIL